MKKSGVALMCALSLLLGAFLCKWQMPKRDTANANTSHSEGLSYGEAEHDDAFPQATAACVQLQVESQERISQGTGIVWKEVPDGYVILTCAHLFGGQMPDKICVKPYGASDSFGGYLGEYIGGFSEFDVGLVKLDKKSVGTMQTVQGRPSPVYAGMDVRVVGNLSGLGLAVLGGVMSVPYEYMGEVSDIPSLLHRIDAPVGHGCSGGGLFARDGHILGMVCSRTRAGDMGESFYLGYAMPWEFATLIGEQILRNNGETKLCNPFDFEASPITQKGENGYMYTTLVVTKVKGEMGGYVSPGDQIISGSYGESEVIFSAYHEWVAFCLSLHPDRPVTIRVKHFGVEKEVEISTKATP